MFAGFILTKYREVNMPDTAYYRVLRLLEAAVSEARLIKCEDTYDRMYREMLIMRILITISDFKTRGPHERDT